MAQVGYALTQSLIVSWPFAFAHAAAGVSFVMLKAMVRIACRERELLHVRQVDSFFKLA